jgi:hypothetical protein
MYRSPGAAMGAFIITAPAACTQRAQIMNQMAVDCKESDYMS